MSKLPRAVQCKSGPDRCSYETEAQQACTVYALAIPQLHSGRTSCEKKVKNRNDMCMQARLRRWSVRGVTDLTTVC